MKKRSHTILTPLVFVITACLLLPWTALAAPSAQGQDIECAVEYTTQADDWLSKLAEKYLGDAQAFPAIVAATNQKHAADAAFAAIDDPDTIAIGWQVCIPTAEDAVVLLAAASVAPAGAPVVVSADALGRTIEFAEPPQRIVAVGKAFFMTADALFLFPEARNRVVALGANNQQANDFLALVDPTYNDLEFLASDVGPEQIVAVRPDAVVLKSFVSDKLGDPLQLLGIPVVYVDLETPEHYERDIRTMGEMFGNTARAEEILSFYRSRVDEVARATSELADSDKPTVLVLQYTAKGGQVAFNVPPTAWIQTTMVEKAGGIPVWTEASQGGGWAVVNFEQIAAWNPDQVFVISYTEDPSAVVAGLKEDSKWQALKAVQSGKLFAFAKDVYSWDQPDTRWVLGLTWMAAKMHPDLFPDYDAKQQIYDFYGQLYGLDQQVIEAEMLPLLQGNVE